MRDEVFAGSELEDYLRLLQSVGKVPAHSWSVRSFGPGEIARLAPRDAAHPWGARYSFRPDTVPGLHLDLLGSSVAVTYNSAFPYGSNDGPVWAGRGTTVAVQGGLSARLGGLSLVVAPVAFRAENASFALMPTGYNGALAYADGLRPSQIDVPQRFGEGAYARIDPGQSTLRLDLPVVSVGLSTANQWWGPSVEYPILLGNNAAGFPHLFVGTPHPLKTPVGTFSGKVLVGQLSQSPYSPAADSLRRRQMSGYVATWAPRGFGGLELGVGRFFHSPWRDAGRALNGFRKPFEPLLKVDVRETGAGPDRNSDLDNQLASAFARWVLAPAGLDVYGEYGREDHNWHQRDFILEPDHQSAYTIGLRKFWLLDEARAFALRGELANARISHLSTVRTELPFYVHSVAMKQGHTYDGQVLGSPAIYAGAGSSIVLDHYHRRGKFSLAFRRIASDSASVRSASKVPLSTQAQVTHSVGFEALTFWKSFDIRAGLSGIVDLNRNFGASDWTGLNLVLRVTGRI